VCNSAIRTTSIAFDLNTVPPGTNLEKALAALPKAQKRGKYGAQPIAGVMNKTEARFAAILEARKRAGEILDYWYESFNVRLAKKTWFKADFLIMFHSGALEFVDVKGGGPTADDAQVKIKVAAEMYPRFGWVQERFKGGGWKRTEYGG
jgi:hypothetical protein